MRGSHISRLYRLWRSAAASSNTEQTLGLTQLRTLRQTSQGQLPHNALPWALALLLGGQLGYAQLDAAEYQSQKSGSEWLESPSKGEGWQLLKDSTRRRLFYKYERRIRDLSQTDKVFHYFAGQVTADGTRVMSLSDLVKAIVAVYPPENSEETRTGGLAGEPAKPKLKRKRSISATSTKDSKFLKAFDIDNDGISYSEYLLLSTFLTIPAQDVTIVFNMFDINSDGSVHIKEFEEITSALQKRLRKVSSVQRTGASIASFDSSRGLKNFFFGPDGSKSLVLKDFAEFIAGLHEEILRLEFEHYDINEDETISGLDFARSIASHADLRDIDKYLDRADSLPPALATMQITYEDFQQFAQLGQQVHSLAVALDFFHNIGGKLEPADFKRATRIVTGKELSDNMVEIVFHLFDTRAGSLRQDELIQVLRNRGNSWASQHAEEGLHQQGLFSCLYSCAMQSWR